MKTLLDQRARQARSYQLIWTLTPMQRASAVLMLPVRSRWRSASQSNLEQIYQMVANRPTIVDGGGRQFWQIALADVLREVHPYPGWNKVQTVQQAIRDGHLDLMVLPAWDRCGPALDVSPWPEDYTAKAPERAPAATGSV
jgi:hypothetical protein